MLIIRFLRLTTSLFCRGKNWWNTIKVSLVANFLYLSWKPRKQKAQNKSIQHINKGLTKWNSEMSSFFFFLWGGVHIRGESIVRMCILLGITSLSPQFPIVGYFSLPLLFRLYTNEIVFFVLFLKYQNELHYWNF